MQLIVRLTNISPLANVQMGESKSIASLDNKIGRKSMVEREESVSAVHIAVCAIGYNIM